MSDGNAKFLIKFYKVVFEKGTKKVIGVEYIRHGQVHTAYAKKEVVISAGDET